MKTVLKMKVDEIEKLKKRGLNIKYVNLRTAQELFGDEVFEDCGTHMYVSLDSGEIDGMIKSVLAHL